MTDMTEDLEKAKESIEEIADPEKGPAQTSEIGSKINAIYIEEIEKRNKSDGPGHAGRFDMEDGTRVIYEFYVPKSREHGHFALSFTEHILDPAGTQMYVLKSGKNNTPDCVVYFSEGDATYVAPKDTPLGFLKERYARSLLEDLSNEPSGIGQYIIHIIEGFFKKEQEAQE